MTFQEICIYLVCTWYILSELIFLKPGVCLVYAWFMLAHLKSYDPSCSRIVIGMQRHTDFGLPGVLCSSQQVAAQQGTHRPGHGQENHYHHRLGRRLGLGGRNWILHPLLPAAVAGVCLLLPSTLRPSNAAIPGVVPRLSLALPLALPLLASSSPPSLAPPAAA
jgi:hypothetical protein